MLAIPPRHAVVNKVTISQRLANSLGLVMAIRMLKGIKVSQHELWTPLKMSPHYRRRRQRRRISALRATRRPEPAFQVKMADLIDNMDLTRIAQPTDKDHQRLEKYKRAQALLEN
jgi:hypothetical protein